MLDDLRLDVVQGVVDVPCLDALASGSVAFRIPKGFRDGLLAKLNINELDLDTQIGDKRRNSIRHMLNLTSYRVMICKPFFFLNSLAFAFFVFSA